MPQDLTDEELDRWLRMAATQVIVPRYPNLRLPPRSDSPWLLVLGGSVGIVVVALGSALFVNGGGPALITAYVATHAAAFASQARGLNSALLAAAFGFAVLYGLDLPLVVGRRGQQEGARHL